MGRFSGKKPEKELINNMFSSAADNLVQEEKEDQEPDQNTSHVQGHPKKEDTAKHTGKKISVSAMDQRRNKSIHVLTTQKLFDYLNEAAWKNRRSVNDYINMLIEEDMKAKQEDN